MKAESLEARSSPITIKNLIKLPYYIISGAKYHTAGRIHTPKPLYGTLHVIGRCDSKCIMCSSWRKRADERELTLAEIRQIFENPLFSSVEKFSLSGGEPTLREDLAQIAEIILDTCPHIKEVLLQTNGLEPDRVTKRVKEVLAPPRIRKLEKFAVSVSLDGYGDIHEKIRRVPHAFERATETIRKLQELQRANYFYLCSTCVVQPLNLDGLVQLSDYGREIGLPIIFSPVCTSDYLVGDAGSKEAVRLTNAQLEVLRGLIEGQLESSLMPSNLPFWREYFKIVGGKGKRSLPCYLRHYCANIESNGMLWMCPADNSLIYGSALDTPPDKLWYSDTAKEIRRRAGKDFCPRCAICCDLAFAFKLEFFYYAGFLLREKAGRLWGKR